MVNLFDLVTRHQIYVEGVKAGEFQKFREVSEQIARDLSAMLNDLEYDNLSQLTKKELNELIRDLRDKQLEAYNFYTDGLAERLQEFVAANVEINRQIAEYVTEEEKSIPLVSTLWSDAKNSPLPATGDMMLVFVANFAQRSAKTVSNAIRQGYANQWTVAEARREIVGSAKKKRRGSKIGKSNNGARAMTATVIHHVDSISEAGVFSLFFNRYIWNSIIDSVTTEICLGRNKKVYVYGEGPLPPAHVNCRSKATPYHKDTVGANELTYYTWMKSQPQDFQDDVLLGSRAKQLRGGELQAKDFEKFVDAKPISIDEYKKKIGLIFSDGGQ